MRKKKKIINESDLNDMEKDLLQTYRNSLGLLSNLIFDLYLINLLKKPNENHLKLIELLNKTDDYYPSRFFYYTIPN